MDDGEAPPVPPPAPRPDLGPVTHPGLPAITESALDTPTWIPRYGDRDATVQPAYARQAPLEPGEVQLLVLYELRERRRIRLEATTVFGRSRKLFRYPDDENRFSEQDASELERLDYVRLGDEDHWVSRTHGVFEPKTFSIRDLNSMHGIRVNGRLIARTPGHPGPPHALESNDRIRLGRTEFVVRVERVGAEDLLKQLSRARTAFVAPHTDAEVQELGAFLNQRKRFTVCPFSEWAKLLEELHELRYQTGGFGVLVVALAVEPLGGDRMKIGDEVVSLDALMFTLANLQGSKVLALQCRADPTGLEHTFRELAFQDTILLTSSVSPQAALDPDALEPDMGTVPRDALRQSVAQGTGVFDTIVDGLDALVRPDSNVLHVDWVEHYRGALKLVVGTREQVQDHEVMLSYIPSDPSEGTFRVCHDLSSRRPSGRLDRSD